MPSSVPTAMTRRDNPVFFVNRSTGIFRHHPVVALNSRCQHTLTHSRHFSSSAISRLAALTAKVGFIIVPQMNVYVIERVGKFQCIKPAGLHLILPLIDRVAYIHSLKEELVTIPNQTAVTSDNVSIQIDGVLYAKIENAFDASYGISNVALAISQVAATTMRSEFGKLSLEATFRERDALNIGIVKAINDAATTWGIKCIRFEIRDIIIPQSIRQSMERQAEAECRRRADILISEGLRDSDINKAVAKKRSLELSAEGNAAALRLKAEATAEAINKVAVSLQQQGSTDAVSVHLAEKYLEAFSNVAKDSTTLLYPINAADASGVIAQALATFKTVNATVKVPNQSSIERNKEI